jgi:uncharacterized protein
MRGAEAWKNDLRAALREALRERKAYAVAVLRETLAAIENAEAVDVSAAPPVQHGHIAGGVAGVGAAEVPRRVLSAEAVTELVERELEERRAAAEMYSAMGRHEEARRLMLQTDVLRSLR